jgi:uncharacterized protein involved in exopolysaccharide biosynthesis
MDRVIELSTLWRRTWQHRFQIGALVLVATVLTAGVSLLMKPWYLATCSLLPPAEEETGFGIARLLKGAAVPGVKIPTQATPADVFLAVLDSRRINEQIVARYHLQQRYKTRFVEDAIKELKSHVRFKLTDAGMIEMSLEDRDPKVAAAMLNTYVELLDQFNREVRMTKGRRTRVFVEGRMKQTQRDLAVAEDRLASYQARNKTAVITPEMSTAAESAANLYSQRLALEVQLGVVQGFTRGGSDEEEQIRAKMAQIDRQLQSLPATGLELARLLREVKIQEQLNALLIGQYEEARIDEARDVVSVDVLDPAVPPQRKSRPRRSVMVLGAFALSLAVGVAYALTQGDPEQRRDVLSAATAAAAR